MKLKHYKGDGWEVKVKYDEEVGCTVWKDRKGILPSTPYYGYLRRAINNTPQGVWFDYMLSYNHLTTYLDNLTTPKIINEREFKNDNFHIKVWETEDHIGAETVWIKEGFDYDCEIGIDKNYTQAFTSNYRANEIADFGLNTIGAELQAHKEEIKYSFTDLCKALERAEQETSELTYDTVVKELEGLEGEELFNAMGKYQYDYVGINSGWDNLNYIDDFFDIPEAFKRGLIKLRRVK